MEEFNPGDKVPVHAVYLGKAGRLPARIRALLDYLAARLADNKPHRATGPRHPRP
jgi:hypothetical protein